MKRSISASGTISSDGKMRMAMDELNAFFAEHKGERIIARFYVAPTGSSEALKGYYFNYVVPRFCDGLKETGVRKTEKQTDKFLRENSDVCWESTLDVETGEYNCRLREIKELSNSELVEHIEFVKQLAAEELGIFVEDPRAI